VQAFCASAVHGAVVPCDSTAFLFGFSPLRSSATRCTDQVKYVDVCVYPAGILLYLQGVAFDFVCQFKSNWRTSFKIKRSNFKVMRRHNAHT